MNYKSGYKDIIIVLLKCNNAFYLKKYNRCVLH